MREDQGGNLPERTARIAVFFSDSGSFVTSPEPEDSLRWCLQSEFFWDHA